jgi:hypothetical protein
MPVRDLLSAASTQGASPADPYFYDVSLLLNGDGTNGAQNNTFLDSSTNNFTITRNGNTTQGSFSPYGSNWGVYYNGSQNFIAPTQTAIGTNDFTLEGWVNISLFTNRGSLIALGTNSSQNGPSIRINTDGSVNATIENSSGITGSYVTSASNLVVGTWYHIAYVRASGTLKLYINGVASGTPVTNTTNCDSTKGCVGGQYPDYSASGRAITGYISNARVVRNQALFSGTFTPSTLPLTTGTVGATGSGAASSITGTVSFLVCNANNFATSWTFDGTPSVQRFSPFNPTAPYSTSVIGGSGYFDGSSSYLTAGSASNWAFLNNGSSFTAEGWFYPTSSISSEKGLISTDANTTSIGISIESGNTGTNTIEVYLFNGSASPSPPYFYTGANAYTINQWNHIAVVYNSSSKTAAIYVNGVSQSLTFGGTSLSTWSFSSSNPTYPVAIGRYQASSPGGYFPGYISDVRLGNTVVYSGNFTPPTAPETPISGTQLLTNFTNAGIPDLAMQNDLQTVGSAQVSTSVVKYGTGSLSFDGSSYLLSNPPSTAIYTLGTGNFTIEFWLYLNSTSVQTIFDTRPASTTGAYPMISYDSGITYNTNGSNQISGGSLSTSTWYYIAVCRSGTSTKMFVNGTQVGSTYTDTTNYICGANRPIIGGNGYNVTAYNFNGYIDDLRITNGLARYVQPFTPPTAALPTY